MSNSIDFNGLASHLLSQSIDWVYEWLPGGSMMGDEYCCAGLRGGRGQSCRVNLSTGAWAEFAGNEKGGDLIALYAAINGLNQGQAAKELVEKSGFTSKEKTEKVHTKTKPETNIVAPSSDAPSPSFVHPKFGKPTVTWAYRNHDGGALFYISRYDSGGKKHFQPMSMNNQGKWVAKLWPAPRPLYQLDQITKHTDKPVMICEGEKAADAAQKIVGERYIVTTWPSGSQAWKKADWSAIYNRSNVLIWPDADEPGIKCAYEIAEHLKDKVETLKLLDVKDLPSGADAADFKGAWPEFMKWARATAFQYNAPEPPMPEKPFDYGTPELPKASSIKMSVMLAGDDAIEAMTAPPQEDSVFQKWQAAGVPTSKSGAPIINLHTVNKIFNHFREFKKSIWFDEFHQKILTSWRTGKVRPWIDVDYTKMLLHLQDSYGLSRLNKTVVFDAIESFAEDNKRNEPRDWMDSLEWDGSKRLIKSLNTHFGVVDNEYTQAVSKNFWISLVARIYEPGCKADHMLILEGNQGTYKSTALNVIGGQWYLDQSEDLQSKDFYQSLVGKLLVEIGELSSFGKAGQNAIKRMLSCRVDNFRKSYGRVSQDYPRQCVFVGSTNEYEYWQDDTGARRIWPVRVGHINIEQLTADRDQIFAEAVYLYKQGHKWHEMPESAVAEQSARREIDPWQDRVIEWMENRENVRTDDILTKCLMFDPARITKREAIRIGKILRPFGWEYKLVRVQGEVCKRWVVTKDSEDLTKKTPVLPERKIHNFADDVEFH